MNQKYDALIHSGRVSSQTRAVLLERRRRVEAEQTGAGRTEALTSGEMATLRCLLARIVPQDGCDAIDLSERMMARLSQPLGDGWRFAALPGDLQAMQAGLETIERLALEHHGLTFRGLSADRQDEVLHLIAKECGTPGVFSAQQATLWFEDVRAGAAQLYISHPDTLARIGYSGIAYGGDGEDLPGFSLIGLNEREAWEPESE